VNRWSFWKFLLLVCCLVACSACYEDVSTAELLQLRALRAGTHTVVSKGDLRVGRFQHFRDGQRLLRFDTATGSLCVLLTSTMDWEGDAKSMACSK
jgi:hypothetical protein